MTITFDDPAYEPAPESAPPNAGRRRAVAAVAAVAVIAGSLGAGYAIGRAATDDSATGAGRGAAATPDDGAGDPPDSTIRLSPAPTDAADAPASDDSGRSAGAEYASDSALGSGAGISASGGRGYSMFGAEPLTLLVERTTADGFTLRVHKGQEWDMGGWGIDGWEPAPWCYESGQLRVSISGNGIADVGGLPWYREPYLGRAVSPVFLGAIDGNPRWVVVVQVPADATNVTVRFADGATDSATPSNGIAVLTVPTAQGPTAVDDGAGGSWWQEPDPVFEVTVDGGAAAGVVGSDGTGSWADNAFRDACSPPPPALPDPGEQPADPAAAEHAIREAMDVLYERRDVPDREQLMDDPTGVAAAREQVDEGQYAEQAQGATIEIEELVFTTPTESWFRYRIETDQSAFDNRYGMARQIDGVWKITRGTLCQDLALAGGDCGSGWEPVVPPSMERSYGEHGEVWSSEGG